MLDRGNQFGDVVDTPRRTCCVVRIENQISTVVIHDAPNQGSSNDKINYVIYASDAA